ncbi:MAG: hypothetical protein OZSIB_2429 [Candidatus Ozemobacter sibiricus]|uniref:Sel1 repeat family protein n=1 Tax=Candidatus Ozemobacter sibiricus TaxID=2268124 RepID=A0A367ZUK9_9BACT|nr:MAG: hypothetical protein OZSIB_2429 [Candidatus Ozemobacter sibiricus]
MDESKGTCPPAAHAGSGGRPAAWTTSRAFLLLVLVASGAVALLAEPASPETAAAEPVRSARLLPEVVATPPAPPPPFDRQACEAAIARGDARAPAFLGHHLLLSATTPEALAMARHWFQVGAERGDPEAAYRLSVCQIWGIGGEADLHEGMRRLEQVASAGHVAAQILMGDLLIRENLTLSMVQQARMWYRRAIAQGSAVARLRCAQTLMSGQRDLTPDFEQALRYVEEAARQGLGDAWYVLGLFHLKGWGGLPCDPAVARQCFDVGARLGSGRAWAALGALLEATAGAPADGEAAIHAFEQAARLFHPRAMSQAHLIAEARRRAAWLRRAVGRPTPARPLLAADLPDQLLEPLPASVTPSSG